MNPVNIDHLLQCLYKPKSKSLLSKPKSHLGKKNRDSTTVTKYLASNTLTSAGNLFSNSTNIPIEHEELTHTDYFDSPQSSQLSCEFCLEKGFLKNADLLHHVIKKHSPNFYKCDICGFFFKLKSDFDSHKKFAHIKIKCTLEDHGMQNRFRHYRFWPETNEILDVKNFFININENLRKTLLENMMNGCSLKIYMCAYVSFHKPLINNEAIDIMTEAIPVFRSSMFLIFNENEISDTLSEIQNIFDSKIEMFQTLASGWHFNKIMMIDLHLTLYEPLSGSTYVAVPDWIRTKHCVINVHNSDNRCFIWSICASQLELLPFESKNHYRIKTLKKVENSLNLNLDFLTFPVSINQIHFFEKYNTSFNINVFGENTKQKSIFPIYLSKNNGDKIIDLLLIETDEQKHYTWIKNMKPLLRNKNKGYISDFCRNCLITFRTRKSYMNHIPDCIVQGKQNIIIPKSGVIEFKNHHHKLVHPFCIYCDFECTLVEHEQVERCMDCTGTDIIHTHVPNSFCFVTVETYSDRLKSEYYLGEDCIDMFINKLKLECKRLAILKSRFTVSLEPDDFLTLEKKICHICEKIIIPSEKAVRDHCHVTGDANGFAHNKCNLKYHYEAAVPLIMHNGGKYDLHLFIKKLAKYSKRLKIIPNSMEQCQTLTCFWKCAECIVGDSKPCSHYLPFRLIDSYKFLNASLADLVQNAKNDKSDFPLLTKWLETEFNSFNLAKRKELLTQKGYYPYEFVTNLDIFKTQMELPPISKFYSRLKGESIDENEYQHACNVYEEFNCNSFLEYHKLYLFSDTFLLADVFQAFRKLSYQESNLEVLYYVSAPSFAFDVMLKQTKIQLDLITDYEQYVFIENSVRGGLAQISKRYSESNNPLLKEFDPKLPINWIYYIDCNNLYGKCMTDYLPYGNFSWLTDNEIDEIYKLLQTNDFLDYLLKNPTQGYFIEADIEYPSTLHEHHNSYPLCPEQFKPSLDMLSPLQQEMKGHFSLGNSSYTKLIPHFFKRHKYKVYSETLAHYVRLGLRVTKIYRILHFNQSRWLKDFIFGLIEQRKNSKSLIKSEYLKMIINSIYGKFLENVRERSNIKLVTTEKYAKRLINQSSYVRHQIFDENLIGIQMIHTSIVLNKAIYVGSCILDRAKTHMYNFYYDVLKPNFPNMDLIMTDTDSFLLDIQTDDLYKTLSKIPSFFDFSNMNKNHILFQNKEYDNIHEYLDINAKTPGKYKDESRGLLIKKVTALKAKLYAILLSQNQRSNITKAKYRLLNKKGKKEANRTEYKRGKGIPKAIVEKHLTYDAFENALFNYEDVRIKAYRISSKHHTLNTIVQSRTGISCYDDKRYIESDNIHTKAYGHFSLTSKNG